MHSLYHALLVQHSRQVNSVRCAEQTIAQLHRYFEDVVLENKLAALVVENLPLVKERSLRDLARVREVGRAAKRAFFFISPNDALNDLPLRMSEQDREPVLLKRTEPDDIEERFVVIADSRFSVLLASVHSQDNDGNETGDEVIWSFEPDLVYSALEYLMARVSAERPFQATLFASAVKASMPKATSLQLTVSVTTKLARLLQEQAGREIAINRIATAIRNSLEVDEVLQTTVNEVGHALNTQHCALRVKGDGESEPLTNCYFRDGKESENAEGEELVGDLDAYSMRLARSHQIHVVDGRDNEDAESQRMRPLLAVPLIYQQRVNGTLMVRSDDPARIWQESEILLLRTVADQVTIAVHHARLYAQTQEQALTDSLTGCFNRRSFELQLEKDLQMATRTARPLSLVIMDVDLFKRVNDNFGHDTGDVALRMIADSLRDELRGDDTAARYGGEEFAVILAHADAAGALVAAERLRMRIEALDIPRVGSLTVSIGVANFPVHASTRDSLVLAADRGLYVAKRTGRNRVCGPPITTAPSDNTFDHPEITAESTSDLTISAPDLVV